jgi:hypothetical protein
MRLREWMQPPLKPKREIGFHAIARERKLGNAIKI